MKYRTTQKAVKAGYNTIICASYCALQHLLSYESAVAYTTRAEGWAADIYDVGGGVSIVTGYAPFGNIRADHEICKKYENAAERIVYSNAPYENTKAALQELLKDFVKDVTQ